MRASRVAFALIVLLALANWNVVAKDRKSAGDYEKQVAEAQVPAAALRALEELAGTAAITEFAEEVEDGRRFYEGTWAGPNGPVDGLVTEQGALVEIEEAVPADVVPAAARAEVEREAGEGTAVAFEKKTLVMYEAHFQKGGKEREVIVLPDGRRFVEKKGDEDDDESP